MRFTDFQIATSKVFNHDLHMHSFACEIVAATRAWTDNYQNEWIC